MDIEKFRNYCLSLPGSEETFPFDSETLVFKVGGKIFALIGLDQPDRANLKCDPEKAAELRVEWEEIQPGYHMNKKHWNTIHFSPRLSDPFIQELVDHSYSLVYNGLPRKTRESIPKP
jgi:predicted DNA-binding protein (MmcQ/YjbR family)